MVNRIFTTIFFYLWSLTALANTMNPDISVIGTIGGGWTDSNSVQHEFDASLSEVELGLKADVDPYFTTEAYLTGNDGGFAVEEGHLDTLALPWNFKGSLGKIRASFGKLNLTHEHVWSTVSPPLLATELFENGALVDHGARVAWLAPLSTYHEVTVEALRGNDQVSFSGGASGDWTGLAHLKNFFDLTDATSLELGASAVQDANGAGPGTKTRIWGADLSLKWRPVESNVRNSISLQAEGAISERRQSDGSGGVETARMPGGWVLLDVQPWQRWHFAVRGDGAADPREPHAHSRAFSGVAGYSPSEFSNLMTEIRVDKSGGTSWTTVYLRVTYAIGPHGAHPF